ncbi:MAG: serine protease [Bacteroidales bacterium]|nr:serine protease [Bacteroidales bacterium]
MKRILTFLIFVLIFVAAVRAQETTAYPMVKEQCRSRYGDANIIGVIITEDESVFVWEYITSPRLSEGWLTLSSSTILTAPQLRQPLRIREWSIVLDDGEFKPLNLNERYNVQADRRYLLTMTFPKLPTGIEVADISTNTGRSDLVWRGIHFNNSGNTFSEQASSMFSSSDDDYFEMSGSGSCFAISSDGVLATCYHVVEDAREIRIRGVNGDFDKTYRAKVIAVDRNNDLALVRIDDKEFSSISGIPYRIATGNADVGESVYALGYPLRAVMGDEIKLTNGLISSCSGYRGDITSYQISVAVQSGNSGCPLFNNSGEVIGVVNARLEVESAAYAVKSPYLNILINSLDVPIVLSQSNALSGLPLADQVKKAKRYVYIIETE